MYKVSVAQMMEYERVCFLAPDAVPFVDPWTRLSSLYHATASGEGDDLLRRLAGRAQCCRNTACRS